MFVRTFPLSYFRVCGSWCDTLANLRVYVTRRAHVPMCACAARALGIPISKIATLANEVTLYNRGGPSPPQWCLMKLVRKQDFVLSRDELTEEVKDGKGHGKSMTNYLHHVTRSTRGAVCRTRNDRVVARRRAKTTEKQTKHRTREKGCFRGAT